MRPFWRGHYLAGALKSRGGTLADQSRAAASGLIEVIKNDGDNSVRASAAFAAASLHRAIRDAGIKPDQSRVDDPIDPKTMARAFNTVIKHDPTTRLAMLGTYQSLGPIGEPAPLLLAALDDPSPPVRAAALQTLAQFTSGADQAVPVLLRDADLKAPPSGLKLAKGADFRLGASNGRRGPASHRGRRADLGEGSGEPESRRRAARPSYSWAASDRMHDRPRRP